MTILSKSYPKTNRLLSKNDFANLRDGSRFLVSGVLLFYFKESTHDSSRLGLAISKRFGKANKRNRAKRVLRESFRLYDLKSSNRDILITFNFKKIAKEKLNYKEVLDQVEQSFNIGMGKIFS